MKEQHNIGYVIQPYGDFITVKGVKMCVSVNGCGDKVVVLLAGFASPSPIIEMKALSSYLEEYYRVVTLEYLGYGLSNPPLTVRTLDNITEEIHEALSALRIYKYSIIAHSIAGVYGLYYVNSYPSEISAFIGLDSSVPKQIDDIDHLTPCLKKAQKYPYSNILWWTTNISARIRLKRVKGYKYPKNMIKEYGLLSALGVSSKTIMNESYNIADNFNNARYLRFPKHIPTMFILSKKSCRTIPKWSDMHQELTASGKSKILTLKGGHNLHLKQPGRLAEEIKAFLL